MLSGIGIETLLCIYFPAVPKKHMCQGQDNEQIPELALKWCQSLLKLDPSGEWQGQLHPLLASDVREPKRYDDDDSEGQREPPQQGL